MLDRLVRRTAYGVADRATYPETATAYLIAPAALITTASRIVQTTFPIWASGMRALADTFPALADPNSGCAAIVTSAAVFIIRLQVPANSPTVGLSRRAGANAVLTGFPAGTDLAARPAMTRIGFKVFADASAVGFPRRAGAYAVLTGFTGGADLAARSTVIGI